MPPNDPTLEPEESPTAPETPGADEADAWLQEYDDDTQARFRAEIERREAAAREAAAKEKELQYSKAMGAWGNTKRELDALGFVRDESGKLAPGDPRKLVDYARQFGPLTPEPPAPPPAAAPADEEIKLDPYDDAETLTRKTHALLEKRFQSEFDKRLQPLLERNQALEAIVAQQQLSPAYEVAKTTLTGFGLQALADTNAYRDAYHGLVNRMPLAQRTDPEALRGAALLAASTADQQLRAEGVDWRTAATPEVPAATQTTAPTAPAPPARPSAGTVARNGLAATTASRGTAAPPAPTKQYTDSQRAVMAASGFENDPEGWEALQTGSKAYTELLRRRREQAQRGRR